ncbi:MAG: hypothetical protein AB7K68_11615 [Bacteriovoracia bacterium]
MENVYSITGGKPDGERGVSLTGEVIYESIHRAINKQALKRFIHRSIQRRLREVPNGLIWASYLVIFSPGQDYEEVRCQVDVETDGDRAGFSIGYGQRPNHAFNDAIERMQWYEKNVPLQLSV